MIMGTYKIRSVIKNICPVVEQCIVDLYFTMCYNLNKIIHNIQAVLCLSVKYVPGGQSKYSQVESKDSFMILNMKLSFLFNYLGGNDV